ncbi:MAG: hypothetical protein Q7R33_08560 [Nitrosarchaeum sp.]|nr:hypothetical protein [Nitrosarchaeum sp.]
MRKEIFFAILAGGAFGLLIAYGAWKLNSSLKPKPTNQASATANPKITTIPTSTDFKIILTKPNNLSVLTESPTILSGVTNPDSYVIVSNEISDTITNASSSGAFNIDVELDGGINQIVITAFNADGNSTSANLQIVYSGQFKSTDGLAYTGVVTDITDSIIQIKNENGDIQQISGDKDADYIKLTNNTSKVITAADVAIGDYLVAMGAKNTNNILDSTRILITDALVKTNRKAFLGNVTDSSAVGKLIMMNNKTNETITVTPSDDIVLEGVNRFSEINDDDKLIVVGEFKEGIIEARTIKVLE